MTTRHVLQLMGELISIADRRSSDLDIIPVLLTDFPSDIQLVNEIARNYGAAVVLADGGDAPAVEGVPATQMSEGLTKAIEALAIEGGKLEVVREGGEVAVRVQGVPSAANPGSRNFLGTLTALFHDDLRGQALGVIAYDQAEIDLPSRRTLWRFLTETLPALGAPLPAALVFCIGFAEIDAQFLAQGTSLRYVLASDRLVQRHSWETSQINIARYAQLQEPVVIFVGAGAARSSGLPLGDEMRNSALRRFLVDDQGLPERQLIGRFFRWLADNDRLLAEEKEQDEDSFAATLTLERVLREEEHAWRRSEPSPTLQNFAVQEEKAIESPSDGIVALRHALTIQRQLVIVTVNFDRLIEHSAEEVEVARDDAEFSNLVDRLPRYLAGEQGPTPILKLHGSIEVPETIVANIEQTTLGLSAPRSEALSALVGTSENPRPWIYVGYSMRDPDIAPELALPKFIDRTDERWVAPVPSAHLVGESLQRREALWKESWFNRCITETADTFFVEWNKRLEESAARP